MINRILLLTMVVMVSCKARNDEASSEKDANVTNKKFADLHDKFDKAISFSVGQSIIKPNSVWACLSQTSQFEDFSESTIRFLSNGDGSLKLQVADIDGIFKDRDELMSVKRIPQSDRFDMVFMRDDKKENGSLIKIYRYTNMGSKIIVEYINRRSYRNEIMPPAGLAEHRRDGLSATVYEECSRK